MFMLPTYINQFILIPRLLVKNKLSFYIVALFLVIIIGLLMYAPVVQYLYQKYGVVTEIFVNENAYSFPNVLYAIVIIGMITMGTTSIELFRRWMIYDKLMNGQDKRHALVMNKQTDNTYTTYQFDRDNTPMITNQNIYFLPMKRSEMSNNPNLEQTKGWENGTFDPQAGL